MCCISASFTLVQGKRKGCDYSLSVACLIGPLIGPPFVCVPPAFYRRNGARWKLAGVYPFESSPFPLENDPPAGYFIPGRSSPLLLCNVEVLYAVISVSSSGPSLRNPHMCHSPPCGGNVTLNPGQNTEWLCEVHP